MGSTLPERCPPVARLRRPCPALGSHPRQKGQQALQGLERGRLPGDDMLHPPAQMPHRDIGLGAPWHHKGPLGGQGGVGSAVSLIRALPYET